MKFNARWLVLAMLLLLVLGCAVTEPTDLDRARIEAAVEAEPTRTIQSLSGELGVSELAVVKALPEGMAREWQDEPETAWEAIQQWQSIYLSASLLAGQIELLGDPKEIEIHRGQDELQEVNRTRLAIDWKDIAAVWLLKNPSLDDRTRAVWFFDSDGQAVLKISAPESVEIATRGFDAMWDQNAP